MQAEAILLFNGMEEREASVAAALQTYAERGSGLVASGEVRMLDIEMSRLRMVRASATKLLSKYL